MQKINPLLEQASSELKNGSNASPTEAGRNKSVRPTTPNTGQGERAAAPDHVDAINQVFAEFEFAYHNQFHRAFAGGDSLAIAKKYWLASLQKYSPAHIVAAAKQLIQQQEYLPSMASMVQACEKGHDFMGLPSARQAYIEACSAPPPKSSYAWSHPAVYYAGKATDWYLLASEPESRAFPIFEYNYLQLCKRVNEGEELSIEIPRPLSNRSEKKLSPEEARARIAKMRKELGL